MVKVAMIAPYPVYPANEGGRVRAANLLKQWSATGNGAVLFSPRGTEGAGPESVSMHHLTGRGRARQFIDPGFLRRAPEIARRERVDVVVSEYPWPGLHGAYLARRLRVPFVLDLPNVEADRFRSTGSPAWPYVAAYERIVTRLARRIFVVSEDDRRRLTARGVGAERIRIVPNGVDPGELYRDEAARAETRARLGIADDVRVVLFFGQLSYAPNQEALAVLERELAPRLARRNDRTEVIVVGKREGTEMPAGVRYAGTVPHMRPYINAADVVAVPVTSGGGTRLKILETVACGTPVVSTAVGAEGIDRGVCGGLLTVVHGWEDFAEALASDDVKRGNTPPGFIDMYSWASIASRIEWPD
jgi:glycosyltransferase involved in cell wall biosynthesis